MPGERNQLTAYGYGLHSQNGGYMIIYLEHQGKLSQLHRYGRLKSVICCVCIILQLIALIWIQNRAVHTYNVLENKR